MNRTEGGSIMFLKFIAAANDDADESNHGCPDDVSTGYHSFVDAHSYRFHENRLGEWERDHHGFHEAEERPHS